MENQNELIGAFMQMKTKEQMLNFLNGILTPKELEEISRRLQIVKMLKRGIPQHTIAKKLGAGVATITRGSRELKMGRFKYI
ncbi:helix-turn-helix domain-containing protein [Candidatus Roizmanbacteria bacterium]|nr:helix-turn-helix domain-containing protein [Candidatus Roizmanbacteria bacterium]